jgi:hypothetical protein
MQRVLAVITYRLVADLQDPFVERESYQASPALALAWLRQQVARLLARSKVLYVVAANVFTLGGEYLDELDLVELAPRPTSRRRRGSRVS